MLGAIFERFVEQSPVSVMVRGLMEKVFEPVQLDRIFATTAKVQYTRELLFSTLVNLMSLVVCGIYPSVNAAYRAKAKEINVSRTALYNKLNGVELSVSAALVRETATQMAGVIEQMGGKPPVVVSGYQTRIEERQLSGSDRPSSGGAQRLCC